MSWSSCPAKLTREMVWPTAFCCGWLAGVLSGDGEAVPAELEGTSEEESAVEEFTLIDFAPPAAAAAAAAAAAVDATDGLLPPPPPTYPEKPPRLSTFCTVGSGHEKTGFAALAANTGCAWPASPPPPCLDPPCPLLKCGWRDPLLSADEFLLVKSVMNDTRLAYVRRSLSGDTFAHSFSSSSGSPPPGGLVS